MIMFIEDRKQSIMIRMGKDKELLVKKRCKVFLNQLCEQYGSTYEGRRQAACKFLHIRQKAPLFIKKDVILFPSLAAESDGCVWINYCQIRKMEKKRYQTSFTFLDDSQVLVDMEYRSALMQMRRCAHYLYALQMHEEMKLLPLPD